jgi:acyl dehydratase
MNTAQYSVGDELKGPVRKVTVERIEWYDSAMLSAAAGELRQVGSNIHTDEDYARAEGFIGVMADGMIMTNWCSSMLLEHFGSDYIERGTLRTKFIKPVWLDAIVHVRGRVVASEPNGGATVYKLDVWCEDENGVKVVDGDSRIEVRHGA